MLTSNTATQQNICFYCHGKKKIRATDGFDQDVLSDCGPCKGTGEPGPRQLEDFRREADGLCTECELPLDKHDKMYAPHGCQRAIVKSIQELQTAVAQLQDGVDTVDTAPDVSELRMQRDDALRYRDQVDAECAKLRSERDNVMQASVKQNLAYAAVIESLRHALLALDLGRIEAGSDVAFTAEQLKFYRNALSPEAPEHYRVFILQDAMDYVSQRAGSAVGSQGTIAWLRKLRDRKTSLD